jgi:hypothetical protein
VGSVITLALTKEDVYSDDEQRERPLRCGVHHEDMDRVLLDQGKRDGGVTSSSTTETLMNVLGVDK